MKKYELLQMIKINYLEENGGIDNHIGLCDCAMNLEIGEDITKDQRNEFQRYIDANVSEDQHTQLFYWDVNDSQIRLDWLDKHIELLKAEEDE